MRSLVVGYGVQGKKRQKFAGHDFCAVVDPVAAEANYKRIQDVPLDSFDAALVCTPDEVKVDLLAYLLKNKKHVLVEKPMVAESSSVLRELKSLAEANRLALYTAYNHRFEPHIARLKQIIDSKKLGQLYWMRMFYANGTARDVRNSAWRDQGSGVLADIGSHLLDTVQFLFGEHVPKFQAISFDRFENRSYDRVHFTAEPSGRQPKLVLEATMLSWRNSFALDLYGENGTAHIDCLCKWGPSTLTVRERVLPSGRPPEESSTLVCADPTWELEYAHFKELCKTGGNNVDNDIWILEKLKELT
jgi:scyllo-inositol 2-dehydrogenase (NADP+)